MLHPEKHIYKESADYDPSTLRRNTDVNQLISSFPIRTSHHSKLTSPSVKHITHSKMNEFLFGISSLKLDLETTRWVPAKRSQGQGEVMYAGVG